MYPLNMYHLNLDETPMSVRTEFRRLSRQVLRSVIVPEDHIKRIRVAAQFSSGEAVQGAIADYFHSCWYEIISDNSDSLTIINEVKYMLNYQVIESFLDCINKTSYMRHTNSLATRWSVIASPSMDVARHHLRTSKGHTNQIVEGTIKRLILAKRSNNDEELKVIESEFFEHCLVCEDSLAFIKVWFKLNKHQWNFDDRWIHCRTELEKVSAGVKVT